MAHRRKCNQITGIYRTADKIENLKIRVTFKTIYSLIKIPPYNPIDDTGTEMQNDETEVVELKWQEKRLSFKEIQSYQYTEQCKTDLEKQYHEVIRSRKLTNEGKIPGKIFTYTIEDKRDLSQFVMDFPEEPKPDNGSSHSKISTRSDNSELILPMKTRKFGNSLDLTNRGFDSYYIMVELHTEIILITINYRKSDGLLIIYPDFNDFQSNPYILDVDAETKQTYHFGIQNISINKKPLILPHTTKFRSNLKLLEQSITNLSLLPSETSLQKAFILFEIIKGTGFEYDNLHVKFNIGIPPTAEPIHESEILYGSTHSSYKNPKTNTWNFSFCHQIALECTNNFKFNDFIDLNLKIISIDEWKRERIEGFTIARVPLQAGYCETQELDCYRIVSDKFIDKLKRYFIGDKGFQEDFSVKRTVHLESQSRYGLKTVTTGVLTLRVYVLMENKAGKLVFNAFDE